MAISTVSSRRSIRWLLPAIVLLAPIEALNGTPSPGLVRLATDKPSYECAEPVKLSLTNESEQATYVWIGPCGLTLERPAGRAWETSPDPYSGCPLCGHQREMPSPLFLAPGATEAIEWDQNLSLCDDGHMQTRHASGRFRFVVRYAEDAEGCRSADDPFDCWVNYRAKRWRSSHSNEFTNTKCGPSQS